MNVPDNNNNVNPLMSMLQNNPQIKSVMEMVKNSNMTPRDLFYQKAKEMGVNPDDVLKILQGFNIK